MIMLSRLIGQSAVGLQSAEKHGTVKGIGISAQRVVSVALSDATIDSAAVRSFEGDVCTYDEDRAGDGDSLPEAIDPRGKLVLDMHGDAVGTITDVGITADGQIDSLILDNGSSVPGSRLQALGSYAAVLNVDLPPPSGAPLA